MCLYNEFGITEFDFELRFDLKGHVEATEAIRMAITGNTPRSVYNRHGIMNMVPLRNEINREDKKGYFLF